MYQLILEEGQVMDAHQQSNDERMTPQEEELRHPPVQYVDPDEDIVNERYAG